MRQSYRWAYWTKLPCLWVIGMSFYPLSMATAAPTNSQQFADWCNNSTQLKPSQRATISALLKQLSTTDCQQAEQLLKANPGLSLQGQEISDLSPLITLPHLTNLNLTDNQIKDLSPLSHLPNLNSFWQAAIKLKMYPP